MILAKLAIAMLLIGVTAGPMDEPSRVRSLALQQKNAAIQAYVQSATNCVADAVVADPHFHRDNLAYNLSELIVESMPKCLRPMQAMIEAYDRYFGEGSGEEFFLGPYLDALPNTVATLIAKVPD